MAKADLGTKRVCPSCAAKFYDLGRQPVRCPKCGHEYDPEAEDPRVAEKAAPEPAEEEKPAEAADEEQDGFGEEADDTPELDAAAAEKMPEDSEDDDDEGSGLSDDLPDGFNEGDVEDDSEDDNTSLLIDEEEDDDFSELAANKDEDL